MSSRPTARLQALCTLDGLHGLDGKLVLAALSDADPAVRRHAIRLSEPFLASDSSVLDGVLKLVDDADSQVQLQLAYTLGTTSDPRVPEALARIAARNASDPFVMGGVWSSVGKENVVVSPPTMGGEDFSYFSNLVPGFYFKLGIVKPGTTSGGLHTPDFRADDSALPVGVRAMAQVVVDYLRAGR